MQLGTRVGAYEVIAKLGEGGMGEVYRARDTRLGRDVAIKVLADAFAADPERLARFEREAKTLASLNHPHIAHVHGFERVPSIGSGQAELSALIMEFVDGEDLSHRLAHGAIPLDEAIPIARQIAEALEVAHDHGVIHRDLKPANIKVRADGSVKVLDFGLAKVLDSAAAVRSGEQAIVSSPTITTPAMTMHGVVLGTAAYMSPEQAKGKPVDRRADIWAFGCVLYEMLTGRRPFAGNDVSDIFASVLKDQPSWDPLPPDTPAHVRRLLAQCLQKDAHRRLPHIGVARIELETSEPLVVPAAAPVATRRGMAAMPWIVLSALFAVVLGATLIRWAPWRSPAAQPPLSFSAEIGANASLSVGNGPSAVLSPDGTTLAFVATADGGDSQLYVRRLDRLEAVILAGTEGARDPFFSPDGQWLGFVAANKLKKVAVSGGAAVPLADVSPNPQGAAWGEDNFIVYAPSFLPGPLLRVAAGGGKPEPLPLSPRPEIRTQRWPQILPGGRGVLLTAGPQVSGFADGRIVVQPLPTGDAKIVITGGYFGRYLASGHLAYISNGTLFVVPFDLDRLEVTGAAQPMVPNIVGNPDNGAAQFSFSGNGMLAALTGKEISTAEPIRWIDRAGKTTPLLAKSVDWTDVELSPDGRRLAMNIRDAQTDIWIYDIERATLTRLPGTPAPDTHPVWTPDSRRITFSAIEEGSVNSNLYWQLADGSGPPQRLTTSPNAQRASSWSPDGKLLGFHQIDPQRANNDALVLSLDGDERSGWKPGRPTIYLNDSYSEIDPMFSPDGKWVAYWSNESGVWEVYVRAYPGPGGKWQISSGGGQSPIWSRTRPELHYGTTSGQIMVVNYKAVGDEFVAERPRPWSDQRLQFRGGGQRFYAMHADGERVAGVPLTSMQSTKHDKVLVVLNAFDEIRRMFARSGR